MKELFMESHFIFFFKIKVTAILGVKLIQGHMKTAYETLGLGIG